MTKEYRKKPIQDRFISKVCVPNDPDACWEWAASCFSNGYGCIGINGKIKSAHRVSYELFCGEITQGMCVCHKCDNPACVNPKHLFLGTHKENMWDMVQKKRLYTPKGSKHGMSKLNELDILEIRKMLNNGLMLKKIAEQFGVSLSAISSIKHGKRWSHVA